MSVSAHDRPSESVQFQAVLKIHFLSVIFKEKKKLHSNGVANGTSEPHDNGVSEGSGEGKKTK